jgi:hypothetical protein
MTAGPEEIDGQFECVLARAGLRDLRADDRAFLLDAFKRMNQPLDAPAGFTSVVPIATAMAVLEEQPE